MKEFGYQAEPPALLNMRGFAVRADFSRRAGHDTVSETTEVKRMLTAWIQELSAES